MNRNLLNSGTLGFCALALRAKRMMLALSCLFFLCLTAPAQEDFNRTVVTDLTNKTAISFEPQAMLSTGKTVTTGFGSFRQMTQAVGENSVVRLLMDETNAVIFGYELTVEQTASNKFSLKFAPLPANFAVPLFAGQKSSLAGNRRKTVLLTLPTAISDQAVEDADELTVNLLFHPQLKIKIADVIRVSATRQKLEPPVVVPRNLTVDDLELAFKNLKINVGDTQFAKGKVNRLYSGSLVWFYLPQKGFFLLSLTPREGYDFHKIGVINDNKITFRTGGEDYEMISEQPILPIAGTWGLWILHDPKYRPPFLAIDDDHVAAPGPPEQKKQPPVTINNDGKIVVKVPKNKTGYENKPPVRPDADSPVLLRDLQIGTATKIENILPKN